MLMSKLEQVKSLIWFLLRRKVTQIFEVSLSPPNQNKQPTPPTSVILLRHNPMVAPAIILEKCFLHFKSLLHGFGCFPYVLTLLRA